MALRLRCPKCRSGNYELREHYAAHTIYCVKGGVLPMRADDHYTDRTTAITAKCECSHVWTARRATSLTDIVIEAQPGEKA